MRQFPVLKRIAVVGGGPSALFLLKSLLEDTHQNFSVDIFEAGNETGVGFPYSREGSSYEHITNVSGNEIPALVTSTSEWLKTLAPEYLRKYGIDAGDFSDYKVFPRLLFGDYLHAQFDLLLQKAAGNSITVRVHLHSRVIDIADNRIEKKVTIKTIDKIHDNFDYAVICSGHQWPVTHERTHPGYYDSPYPPIKISNTFNESVAIKGSSLTAIDAVRTLAAQNGVFSRDNAGKLVYIVNEESKNFCIVMHSLQGLLPGIRFHLEDSHLSANSLLSEDAIISHRSKNDGFLSLDFIFDKDFKEPMLEKDPAFYNHIKHMSMEMFVDEMMQIRERADPFQLLRAEYEEARLSIKKKESVHWKEMLAVLSFAMNYPAKYFSAEDMMRLQKVLMPLISIIIAFVPQNSCEELFALQDAGILRVVAVERESNVTLYHPEGVVYHHKDEYGVAHDTVYKTFIDCTGQPHLWLKDFPFNTLVKDGTVSQALIRFRSYSNAVTTRKEYPEKIVHENDSICLKVPGISITDSFSVVGEDKKPNPRLFIMAVPFIGGYNPDYSGLDFCAEASHKIVAAILEVSA
ncbi:MAG: FAD/NAD(P)-binding protein [Chitinophagaceae bacterium]